MVASPPLNPNVEIKILLPSDGICSDEKERTLKVGYQRETCCVFWSLNLKQMKVEEKFNIKFMRK